MNIEFEALESQGARVFKAGNSLAIRIPKTIAKRMSLEDGAAVEMAVESGMIHIRRSPPRGLDSLIERITPQNVHASIFDDDGVGAERW